MTGFILTDKPEGITSFLAVAKCRRIFSTKKCGHTGTLDPLATGVLVVAVGNATRFIELIPSHRKEYIATLKFGISTDTLDITGEVLKEESTAFSVGDVENVLSSFVGKISQVPPMFSALKKDGVRLYDLARKGLEVERESREVEIFSAELLSFNESAQTAEIKVDCSAGTYIRTLVDDLGKKLGSCAVMTKLKRTKANGADIESCFTFDQLEMLKENGELEKALIPVDRIVDYPKISVSAAQAKRFSNGGDLDLQRVRQIKSNGFYCIYSPDDEFCGVGEAKLEEGTLFVKRVFVQEK